MPEIASSNSNTTRDGTQTLFKFLSLFIVAIVRPLQQGIHVADGV
jgi:hypothetical protein